MNNAQHIKLKEFICPVCKGKNYKVEKTGYTFSCWSCTKKGIIKINIKNYVKKECREK